MIIDIDESVLNSEITSLKPGETFLYRNGQRKGGFDAYMVVNPNNCKGELLFDLSEYPIVAINLNTGKLNFFKPGCPIIVANLKVVKEE